MESYIADWLNLLVRWLHLITGIGVARNGATAAEHFVVWVGGNYEN